MTVRKRATDTGKKRYRLYSLKYGYFHNLFRDECFIKYMICFMLLIFCYIFNKNNNDINIIILTCFKTNVIHKNSDHHWF